MRAIQSKKDRIGLFGGTFDPVHFGHLKIALLAKKRFCLKKIIFIPSARPPHKMDAKLIAFKHRFKMISLALKNKKGFYLSDIEFKRKNNPFTIDTVRYFKKTTKADIYFIAGADSLLDLTSWKDYKDLIKECHFVVANRSEFPITRSKIPLNKISLLRNKDIDISSSTVRERISKGLGIKRIVPDAVRIYIMKRGLYK